MKLSSRYPWHTPSNRLTQAYQARRAAGLPIADLSVSNPTEAELPLPAGLWDSSPASLRYRPSAQGQLAAREAIAAYYAEDFGVEVSPSRIQLCASTSEGYSFCLKLLADPGDEVLIPQPSYPLLEHLLYADGIQPVPYLTHYAAGQWILDRERLLSSLTPRTRAIILVHPNNPTGHFWTAEDLDWLLASLPPHLAILSDEVFADYCWQAPSGPRTLAATRAFCLSGLSKLCALPQMKLGWIVMPPDPAVARAMEFIADTYLSVSSPIAERAPHWLARRAELQAPIRERCLANRQHFPAVEAGWSAILQGDGQEEEDERVLRLLAEGFWLQPGYYYDLPHRESYVVSLLTPPERLAAGLAAFTSCGK